MRTLKRKADTPATGVEIDAKSVKEECTPSTSSQGYPVQHVEWNLPNEEEEEESEGEEEGEDLQFNPESAFDFYVYSLLQWGSGTKPSFVNMVQGLRKFNPVSMAHGAMTSSVIKDPVEKAKLAAILLTASGNGEDGGCSINTEVGVPNEVQPHPTPQSSSSGRSLVITELFEIKIRQVHYLPKEEYILVPAVPFRTTNIKAAIILAATKQSSHLKENIREAVREVLRQLLPHDSEMKVTVAKKEYERMTLLPATVSNTIARVIAHHIGLREDVENSEIARVSEATENVPNQWFATIKKEIAEVLKGGPNRKNRWKAYSDEDYVSVLKSDSDMTLDHVLKAMTGPMESADFKLDETKIEPD